MKARLLVLEGIQEKRLKEMDTRLSAIEVGQKKAPSRTIENQSVPDVAIPSLRNAIAQCVQQVRTSPEAKAETAASSGKFWTDFDAYYNSVSREVKNNVVYQGSRPALYMFNKCLGANGFAIQ